MSTRIGQINNIMNVKNNSIQITRFSGGKKNGVSVQLTNSLDYSYLQFNVSDLKTLIPLLEEHIINVSNVDPPANPDYIIGEKE